MHVVQQLDSSRVLCVTGTDLLLSACRHKYKEKFDICSVPTWTRYHRTNKSGTYAWGQKTKIRFVAAKTSVLGWKENRAILFMRSPPLALYCKTGFERCEIGIRRCLLSLPGLEKRLK